MAMVAVTTALLGFFAFVIMRVTTPQMTTLFSDLSAEDFLQHHQGSGTPGDSLRASQRRRRHHGAEGQGYAVADEARRRQSAQGGGVGYEIFDNRTPSAPRSSSRTSIICAHWRANSPAPSAPSTASSGPSASRAAGAAAVLARNAEAVGVDRAAGARHPRTPADPRYSPCRRLRRQRAEAAAGIDRRRGRPVAGRRLRQGLRDASRRAPHCVREAHAQRGRGDRLLGRRPGPRPRPAHRRSTTTRSPRPRTSSIPRAACCAPPRPARNPR